MIAILAMMSLSGSVTFASLVREMGDRTAIARWPSPEYRCLQASSYNRESTRRDQPGWFADSDGVGYVRKEGEGEQAEYVLMEHSGPGCITKMWTPFFYYDFNERRGPNIQIYLDGSPKPVLDESLIELVIGKGSIGAPWAAYSARAGNLYLPIPFAKSARVTMKSKPFYFSINYRAYPEGTRVETFEPSLLKRNAAELTAVARQLAPHRSAGTGLTSVTVAPQGTAMLTLPAGANAVDEFAIDAREAVKDASLLRSVVLSSKFDGTETISCPLGDFFCSADSIHPFDTVNRSVTSEGLMTSRWIMPYRSAGTLRLTNLGNRPVRLAWRAHTRKWNWDARSMHFFARWRPDDIVPGSPFTDWNFIDIHGKGVYVGDAWTVLNIRPNSWWGEGDEKVYVDDAWDKGFPTHFGTGTEDYYGWAGGVYPELTDQFSAPFLSNVKVGGLDGHTQGYNICTRVRGLDAIPFHNRLRFDMESSFGTDMRERWDLLGYTAVTFFYAMPGATHNRPTVSQPKPILSMNQLQSQSARIRGKLR